MQWSSEDWAEARQAAAAGYAEPALGKADGKRAVAEAEQVLRAAGAARAARHTCCGCASCKARHMRTGR